MDILIVSGINLVGIITCYVLGYRRGVTDNKPKPPQQPTADCICGHKPNTQNKDYHTKLLTGSCSVLVSTKKDNHLVCACKGYIAKPVSLEDL